MRFALDARWGVSRLCQGQDIKLAVTYLWILTEHLEHFGADKN